MRRAALYGSLAAALGALGLLAAGCGGSSGGKSAGGGVGTTTTIAAGSGGSGGRSSSNGPARAAELQAFRSCLTAHGVTPRGGRTGGGSSSRGQGQGRGGGLFSRLTPAQRQAFRSCRSKLPNGGLFRGGSGARRPPGGASGAYTKYTRCLAQHGVTFGKAGQSPTAFRKAQAACRALLPSAAD